jgi:hypothetical protein
MSTTAWQQAREGAQHQFDDDCRLVWDCSGALRTLLNHTDQILSAITDDATVFDVPRDDVTLLRNISGDLHALTANLSQALAVLQMSYEAAQPFGIEVRP